MRDCAPGTRTPTTSSRARRAAITPGRKARRAGYPSESGDSPRPTPGCVRSGADRGEVAAGSAICSLAAETSTPSASRRRASARSSERSTLSAPATLPSFRYQTENSPPSRSPRQISSSHSCGGADVLEARPVGEIAEEVGDDVVVGVLAEHVAGGVHALLHRHVPVLDPQPAAVDDAVVGAAVAGGVDALGRGLQLRVADDPVVDLEPGALGEHRVGAHAGADDHRVALDREAALGDHAP